MIERSSIKGIARQEQYIFLDDRSLCIQPIEAEHNEKEEKKGQRSELHSVMMVYNDTKRRKAKCLRSGEIIHARGTVDDLDTFFVVGAAQRREHGSI